MRLAGSREQAEQGRHQRRGPSSHLYDLEASEGALGAAASPPLGQEPPVAATAGPSLLTCPLAPQRPPPPQICPQSPFSPRDSLAPPPLTAPPDVPLSPHAVLPFQSGVPPVPPPRERLKKSKTRKDNNVENTDEKWYLNASERTRERVVWLTLLFLRWVGQIWG